MSTSEVHPSKDEHARSTRPLFITLGVVLLKMDKADEAQTAIEKALSFRPEHPQFNLHMAQVYEKKGMKDEALRLADPLLARPGQLDPESYEELRGLIKRLRGGA